MFCHFNTPECDYEDINGWINNSSAVSCKSASLKRIDLELYVGAVDIINDVSNLRKKMAN